MEIGGRQQQPCLDTEQGPWPQSLLAPTCSAPNDSLDSDRDSLGAATSILSLAEQPLQAKLHVWLAPTQPQLMATEGR